MKELTGGDPLQARGLYSESEIFDPQFNLVVCTNNLFDIESNDDGTWRRIRKCNFVSKFVDEGEQYNDDTPYIFVKDKSLKEKLPSYAEVFASILVKRAFETDGVVEDCEYVMNESRKYRKGQDHIAGYILDRIEKTDEKTNDNKPYKIGKKALYQDFKTWFQQEQGLHKIPKSQELYDYMDKKFGICTSKGWNGIRFIHPEEEDDE
jgi:putative DNA primase/helicase